MADRQAKTEPGSPKSWHCLGCGHAMNQEMAVVAQKVARHAGHSASRLFHVCDKCRTMHIADDDGLRLPTLAEKFDLEFRAGEQLPDLGIAKARATLPEPPAKPTIRMEPAVFGTIATLGVALISAGMTARSLAGDACLFTGAAMFMAAYLWLAGERRR